MLVDVEKYTMEMRVLAGRFGRNKNGEMRQTYRQRQVDRQVDRQVGRQTGKRVILIWVIVESNRITDFIVLSSWFNYPTSLLANRITHLCS